MSRIICIAKSFPKVYHGTDIPTGETELLTDYAFDEDTGKVVIVPPEHPRTLGAVFDHEIGEWVIPEKKPQPHWGKGEV